MEIPRAFTLFAQKIVVQWVDDLVDDCDCVGVARMRKNTIELQSGTGAQINRPRTQIEQTFCHELVHWILHLLGEEELDKDEKLVDKIGSLLHQALSTFEYDEDEVLHEVEMYNRG